MGARVSRLSEMDLYDMYRLYGKQRLQFFEFESLCQRIAFRVALDEGDDGTADDIVSHVDPNFIIMMWEECRCGNLGRLCRGQECRYENLGRL